MDFDLTEEQQMIVKTTRDFVVNELYPHEAEIEETGVLRHDLRDAIKAKAIEAGLYAANMPAEVGGAGLDTLTWVLYEKELGRANYALHWTCVARPSNILMACKGEQREKYLFPSRARREIGLPRHDRTRRGLGRARHEDLRQAGWRRLGHQRHQAFHQPCRRGELRHPLCRHRRGRHAARQEEADHRLPRRQGNAGLHRARRLQERLAPRLQQLHPRIQRLPGAQDARCWARCTRASRWPTTGWAPRGCRWPPPASAGPSARSSMPSNMPWTASSSASRSASSRACPSSWPTWRWN